MDNSLNASLSWHAKGMQWANAGKAIWRRAKPTLLVLLVLFIVGYIVLIMTVGKRGYETSQAVARIHAAKLTYDDVFGKLPPQPDPVENNKTLAGIDVNNNGIRDDVEIAIYENHKDAANVAAALWQYAKTEQMFLTEVFNTETWKAVAEEDGRASRCISETYPRNNLKKFLEVVEGRRQEVERLVFNTPERKKALEDTDRFTTSFGSAEGESCDVDVSNNQ